MAGTATAFDLTCGEAINLLKELKNGFETVLDIYKGDDRAIHEEADKKAVIECYFASCLRIYLVNMFQPRDESAIRVQDIAQLYSLFTPFMDRLDIMDAMKNLDVAVNKWPGKPFQIAMEVAKTEHMILALNLSQQAQAQDQENSKAQSNNMSLNSFKNKLFAKQIARKRAMMDMVKDKLEKVERDRLEAKGKGGGKQEVGTADVEESIRKALDGTEDEELMALKRQWEAKRQQKEKLKALLLQQKQAGNNNTQAPPGRTRAHTSVLDAPLPHPASSEKQLGPGHARKPSVTAKTKKKKKLPTAPNLMPVLDEQTTKVLSPGPETKNSSPTHKVPTPTNAGKSTDRLSPNSLAVVSRVNLSGQPAIGRPRKSSVSNSEPQPDDGKGKEGGENKPVNNLKAMWEAKANADNSTTVSNSAVTTPLKQKGQGGRSSTPQPAKATPRTTKGWKKKTPRSGKRTPNARRKNSGTTPKGGRRESKTQGLGSASESEYLSSSQKLDMGQALDNSDRSEPDSPVNPLNASIAPPSNHHRMMLGPPPVRPPPGRSRGMTSAVDQACSNFTPMHPVYFKTKCKSCQQELKHHGTEAGNSSALTTPPKSANSAGPSPPSRSSTAIPPTESGKALPKPRHRPLPPKSDKGSPPEAAAAAASLTHVKRATVKRGSRKAPSGRKFSSNHPRTVDSPSASKNISLSSAETTPTLVLQSTPTSGETKTAAELKKEQVKARLAAKKMARTAEEKDTHRARQEQQRAEKEKAEQEQGREETKRKQDEADAAELARLEEEERQLKQKEQDRLEKERLEKESKLKEEAEKVEAEKEKAEKEKTEQALSAKLKREQDKTDRAENEKAEKEKEEREKLKRYQLEHEQALLKQDQEEQKRKKQEEEVTLQKRKRQEEDDARELARLEEEERQLKELEEKAEKERKLAVNETQKAEMEAIKHQASEEARQKELELEAAKKELEKIELNRKMMLDEESILESQRLKKLRREKEELDGRLAAARRLEEEAVARIKQMRIERQALEKGGDMTTAAAASAKARATPAESPESSPNAAQIGPGFRISFQNQTPSDSGTGPIVFGDQRKRRGSFGSDDSDSEGDGSPSTQRTASMTGGLKIHW
eukprot:gb/GEZN01000656.1/.p1 GENE.gb/GEZN01000656.1/~~gb/GEZN01000656.1/.p1  ORF type:complete len:1113 (-),score=307.43 gb/GEZN01000656.1/:371-3709(-)